MRLDVFQSRRVLLTALLGFSSGVPLQLTGVLLAARLAYSGVDLKAIGAASMVALPYTFKWAWAPLLDRLHWPFLGRRRGWLIVLQTLLAGAILYLGTIDPVARPYALIGATLVVAFLSASQDIVVDAFNTDRLAPEERAAGASAYLVGYRGAMLLTGIAILSLAGRIGWEAAYGICAAMMGVGVVATLLAEEPPLAGPQPSMVDVVWKSVAGLLLQRRIVIVLLFVAFYRFSEFLVAPMVIPFLKKVGNFSLDEVAAGYQLVGFAGTAVGGAIGGSLVARYTVRRCLVPFGILFGGTNLLWIWVAYTGHSLPVLAIAAFLDHGAAAMGAGAFIAFLMSRCDRAYSATQYALLSSLSSLGGRLLGYLSAVFVAAHGWPWFWAATTLIALPALALIPLLPEEREVKS